MDLKTLPLTSSEKQEAYDFTRQWFFTSEPLSKHWKEMPSSDEVSYTRALEQGFSLKLVDEEGNLAAICINGDESRLQEGPKTLPQELQQLYDFFDLVSSECEEIRNFLTVMVVAVAEPYRKQGLCKRLLNETKSLAFDKGFSGVSMLCTSVHSANAAAAAGWNCILRKPYSSYKHRTTGEVLYSPSLPHSHVAIYTTQCP